MSRKKLTETTIKPVPKEKPSIGIDTSNAFLTDVISAAEIGSLDFSSIDALNQSAQNREQSYELIDSMSQDDVIAAALETYTEDTIQTNDKGEMIWIEAEDANIQDYVSWLLSTLNIEKSLYQWVYSLVRYGDLYVRLYRTSDVEDDNLFKKPAKDQINEDIKVHVYDMRNPYIPYVEMVNNPGEMFDLQKFGKTYGYIRTPINMVNQVQDEMYTYLTHYKMKQDDVQLFDATTFVHACMDNTNQRQPETVDISTNDVDEKGNTVTQSYIVKRGQSILYNSFRIWRELNLLEMSALMNRLTKSALVRVLNVEVGDMPKEQVQVYLQRLKEKIEQKSAINTGNSMSEYTNPGPIENTIYIPSHGGQGAITATSIGGDFDPKSLVDLEYFRDKLFGGLKIPKQYLGCLRGNTPILLLNGETVTVEEMFNNKEKYIGKGIMACNSDGSLQPTVISNLMLTKPSTGFIRIYLDNGEYVDVTNDHRMMLRDGTFTFAENLKVGDSLMPYYDYIKDGRRYVLDNKEGKYKPQYRVVAESVCDIPAGYQVHHKDVRKINDDFDNLIPLIVAEHYAQHAEMLHEANRTASQYRHENNLPNAQTGAKMINNGIAQKWLHEGEIMPEGYEYGMLPFTEEHKNNISKALTGVPKTYDAHANFGPNASEKSKAVKAERKAAGMYDEQYAKQSERCKEEAKNQQGWHSPEAKAKRLAHYADNRINKVRYVRCLCCGKIQEIKCNDDWYNDYLNKNNFWFCSKECSKISSKGKLARSYKLLRDCDFNGNKYEEIRWDENHRPDTYFKYDTLENKLDYLENYVPECNHKIVDIEYIDVAEPAYDISVAADCHTFALPCGIFVHNCTDDSTGFNGGSSLTLISSRYAKTIKKLQATVSQLVTDIINLFLLDRHFDNYIGHFKVRMQEPVTQEEKDRRESVDNRIRYIGDLMQQLTDIEDKTVRLKIYKSLLGSAVNDSDVMLYLQDYIDKLEKEEKDKAEKDANKDESGSDNTSDETSTEESLPEMPEEESGEETLPPLESVQEQPKDIINEKGAESEDDDSYLPSPDDLEMDMTKSEN